MRLQPCFINNGSSFISCWLHGHISNLLGVKWVFVSQMIVLIQNPKAAPSACCFHWLFLWVNVREKKDSSISLLFIPPQHLSYWHICGSEDTQSSRRYRCLSLRCLHVVHFEETSSACDYVPAELDTLRSRRQQQQHEPMDGKKHTHTFWIIILNLNISLFFISHASGGVVQAN